MKRRHLVEVTMAFAAALAACGGGPAGGVREGGLANGDFSAKIGGRTVHYEVHGAGPAVMTVPNSWGFSVEGLRALFRPLESDVTMVYFDPRGMGGSGPAVREEDMGLAAVREDFHALRRHLGLEKVHAIGWSDGALNLILLAADHPETLRSAVFVHGVASFTEDDGERWAAEHPRVVERLQAMEAGLADDSLDEAARTERMKAFWLTEYFPTALYDRANVDLLQHAFKDAQFSYAHAAYGQRVAPFFDGRDRLAAIQIPCLVIAGAADGMPPEKVMVLADGLPDATYVLFERSGHFSPLEEPGRFAEVVTGFVTSI